MHRETEPACASGTGPMCVRSADHCETAVVVLGDPGQTASRIAKVATATPALS